MSAQFSPLPPRISDLYGEARLDVLYKRAAAATDTFRQQQARASKPGRLSWLVDKLRGNLALYR